MNRREHAADDSTTSSDVIEPIEFRPAGATSQLPRFRMPWAQVFIGLVVLIGAWGAWYVVTARSVEVVTQPADADVEFDELFAPAMGGHWVLRPGPRSIVVSAPGYLTFNDDLVITDKAIQQHEVILKALPGHLRVEVEPVERASATVDDLIEASVPSVIGNIEAGAHEVRITADRYLPFTKVVEIEGKDVEQTLKVVLNPAWADVSISSEPSGASVVIDAEAAGATPFEQEVMHGERVFELQLPGFKTWKRTLEIVPGQALNLPPVILAKADGFVSVTSKPSGASITVGGEFKGRTPVKFAVTPGKQLKVSARREGYAPSSRAVSAASGETASLNIELKPELAAVQIITTPEDADLLIDGEPRGSANQTLKLPTHEHEIEIRKAGYVAYKTTITPRKGVRKQIKVRLKTPTEAQAAQTRQTTNRGGKDIIKSFAGQDLKLFRGGNVTLGSSRREAGRRANEVLRQVTLTRPFYFGVKEVTNGEFRRFLANHTAEPINGVDVNGDKHPVVKISWQSAAAYCNWLSRKDSLPVFYQIKSGKVLGVNPAAIGYRLPTEAEWAWVARTAPNSEEMFKYPWAGKFPPRGRSGNYADQSASRFLGRVIADYDDGFPVTAPVGTYLANLRGVYDLGGNVSEWVNDYYSATPTPSNEGQDPLGPRSGETHVIKGSNWAQSTESELRFAYRDFGNDPRDDVGFRIARYAQ